MGLRHGPFPVSFLSLVRSLSMLVNDACEEENLTYVIVINENLLATKVLLQPC